MKIEFDNAKDKELFNVLIDNMLAMDAGFEDDEINFLNRVLEEIK